MPREFIRIEDHRPVWQSFRIDNFWSAITGTMNGEPAWSDGNVMMLGDPPPSFDGETTAKQFDAPLKRADRNTLQPITPLAVAHIGEYQAVVFSDRHIINVRYWDLLHERWPNATWFGDETSRSTDNFPMVIRDGEKLVAILMAIRPDHYQDEITAVLQSANAGNDQPANESGEEHERLNNAKQI